VRGVDKAGNVLSLHPLQVDVVISSGEDNLIMAFNWLVVLGVVTVTITLTTKNKVDGEALNSVPNTLHSSPTSMVDTQIWSLPNTKNS